MGWGGGTQIASDMIRSIEEHVPHQHTRVEIYRDLIATLEHADWDNLGECMEISDAFDEAIEKVNPGAFDEDGEEPADVQRCPKCLRTCCNGYTGINPDCDYPQWAHEYLTF